jgi:diamine N-acetyltransferase
MNIELRDITRDNFRKCIDLKVAEHQTRFVATNVMSIAQSKVMPELIPLGVYDGDELVGFVLHGPDAGKWWLVRLMVGEAQQGKGYGKAAIRALVERLGHEAPEYRALYLSFVPGNERAERLYREMGFEPTGEVDEGEIVVRLAFDQSSAE